MYICIENDNISVGVFWLKLIKACMGKAVNVQLSIILFHIGVHHVQWAFYCLVCHLTFLGSHTFKVNPKRMCWKHKAANMHSEKQHNSHWCACVVQIFLVFVHKEKDCIRYSIGCNWPLSKHFFQLFAKIERKSESVSSVSFERKGWSLFVRRTYQAIQEMYNM